MTAAVSGSGSGIRDRSSWTGGGSGAPVGRRSSAGGTQRASGSREASGSGTWASETYSAKRRAESRSAAHARSARSARPPASGRVVPRAKKTGRLARRKASWRCARYSAGERRKTAMRSKGTPRAAAARMPRAISTHSRASPGQERSVTVPSSAATGGAESWKRCACAAASEFAGTGGSAARCRVQPRVLSSTAVVRSSPAAAVARTAGARRTRAPSSAASRVLAIGRSRRRRGRPT